VCGGDLIGMLQLSNKEGGYNEKDKDLLDRIGERLAPILRTRLLRDREEKRRKIAEEELRILNEHLQEEVEIRTRALRESEQWMRSIFNALEEAVLVVSPNRTIREVNLATEKMFGYTSEEVAGQTTEVFHVDHDHCVVFGQQISKAFRAGKSANFEFETRRKNGEIFPTSHTVSLLRDDHGTPFGIVSVVRDLTERKLAEKALSEGEQLLRTILATSPVGIALSKERRIEWANEAWKQMFGFEDEREYLGQDARILYPSDEEYDCAGKVLFHDLAAGKAPETDIKFTRKDGSVFDAQVKLKALDPRDPAKGIISAISDITSRKRGEQRITEAYEFGKTILAATPVGVTTYRSDGQCVSTNAAMESILGATHEEVLKQNFREIASWKQSGLLSDAEEVLSTGVPKQREVHMVTTFGKEAYIKCQFARFTYGGEPHLLVTVADLTELKQTERQLRASEREYRELVELLPQLVYELDGEGFVIFWNDAGSRMTGYSSEDISKGLNFRELFQQEDLDRIVEDWSSALRGEAPQGREYPVKKKDGDIIPVVVYSSPVREDDRIVGLRGVAVDISERKQAEETIRQQNEFLHIVLES
jgi:PAS domain S-box-containing protein